MGRLEGTIVIKNIQNDDKNDVKNDLVNDLVNDVKKNDVVSDMIKDETRKLVMDSFRDHSYGKYSGFRLM
jgi:hypothetical protein